MFYEKKSHLLRENQFLSLRRKNVLGTEFISPKVYPELVEGGRCRKENQVKERALKYTREVTRSRARIYLKRIGGGWEDVGIDFSLWLWRGFLLVAITFYYCELRRE